MARSDLRRLREIVDRLAPRPHLDDDFGVDVGNWASLSQPASDQAAPKAQQYVRKCLDEAWQAGRDLGLRRCRMAWWWLTALALVAFIIIPRIL